LSDATDEEAQIKRLIVAAANEVVALIDHTKWGGLRSQPSAPLRALPRSLRMRKRRSP